MTSKKRDLTGRTTGVLAVMSLFASVDSAPAADVYTFETVTTGALAAGQDNWTDAPGAGGGVIELDAAINGTKVVRHHKETILDQPALLTRVNDAQYDFLAFSGSETNAIIQFEATGEHIAMFALGTDLNGDGCWQPHRVNWGLPLAYSTGSFGFRKQTLARLTMTGLMKAAGTQTAATIGTGSSCG